MGPDGNCDAVEMQLIGPTTPHMGSMRGQMSVDVDESPETHSCTVTVVTNKVFYKPANPFPSLPVGSLSAPNERTELFYGGRHRFRMRVYSELKKKTPSGGVFPVTRATVRSGLSWWDLYFVPGASVYGAHKPYSYYNWRTSWGWTAAFPLPLEEFWTMDNPDFVGSYAKAMFDGGTLGSAWSAAYFVAAGGGQQIVRCPNRTPMRRGKNKYRWVCSHKKTLHEIVW
jgi:hypothetical protein